MIKKKEEILTDASSEEPNTGPKEVSDISIYIRVRSSCLQLKDLTEIADMLSDLSKLKYQVCKVESHLEVNQNVSRTLNSVTVELQDWHEAESPF